MVTLFTVLFAITFCCLFYTIFLLRNASKGLKLSLMSMMIAGMVSCLCHIIIINTQNYKIASICYSVFFISIDVSVFSIFEYSRKFTKTEFFNRSFSIAFLSIFAIDCLCIIFNIPWEHMFSLYKMPFDNDITMGVAQDFIYKIDYANKKGHLYDIHLALNYVALLLTLLCILRRMILAPTPYKFMYRSILVSLAIVIVGDAFYVFIKLPIDFSIIFTAICAICIAVFTPNFVPPKMLAKLMQDVVKMNNDGVQVYSIEGNLIYENDAMQKMVERFDTLGFDTSLPFRKLLDKSVFATLKEMNFEQKVENQNGQFYLDVVVKPLLDKKSRFMGAFLMIHDKTTDVKRNQEEHYRATHDQLTGIYSKEHFYERAKELLDSNPDEDFVLVCSDIDNFKLINDLFGKEVGDNFLKRCAKILTDNVKGDSVYARLESDHFAILMNKKNFNEEEFILISDQASYIEENLLYPVNMHLGFYQVEDKTLPISVMCDRAFMAINTVRGEYLKKVAYYTNDLRENILREQKLIGEFSMALVRGEFEMYLQPQFSADGVLHGAEALVRWNHPTEGIIHPNDFISLFERNGFISSLDLFMWEKAAQKLKDWNEAGITDKYISVNISPKDFLYVDIYKVFTDLVQRYKISPKNLNLEITESAILLNFDRQLELINKLRDFGFSIEIDDFGSGYSSLNMLKDVPFDILKIDMEFLHVKHNKEKSVQILRSIINLSKNLKMPVIAEGVETSEQINFLNELGCDLYQGFYFSKPIRVEDFQKKYIDKE